MSPSCSIPRVSRSSWNLSGPSILPRVSGASTAPSMTKCATWIPFGAKLCVERLAQHASAAHRSRVRVLAAVTAHGGGRRGHEDRALAAGLHERTHGRSEAKQPERRQTPAHFERLVAGVRERSVADLCAQVVHGNFDRADVRLDGANGLLDAVVGDCVEYDNPTPIRPPARFRRPVSATPPRRCADTGTRGTPPEQIVSRRYRRFRRRRL